METGNVFVVMATELLEVFILPKMARTSSSRAVVPYRRRPVTRSRTYARRTAASNWERVLAEMLRRTTPYMMRQLRSNYNAAPKVMKTSAMSTAERKRGYRLAQGNMRIVKQKKGPVKRAPAKASLYGSVAEKDQGGIETDNNCVYLGHATYVPLEMIESLGRAMTRKLFRKAGLDCKSWEETLPALRAGRVWGVRIERFFRADDGTASIRDPIIGTTASGNNYNQFAVILTDLIKSNFSESDHEMEQIALIEFEGTTQLETASKMDASRVYIHFQCTSEMRIQNITQAQGSSGANAQLIEDIGNNPLHGYYLCGKGTGFQDKGQLRVGGLLSGNDPRKSGFISAFARQGLIRRQAGQTDYARKPLTANDFLNATMQNKAYVKPGDIKISRIFSKHSMTINGFLNTFRKDINDNNDATGAFIFHNYGKCAMWGLRRIVDMAVTSEKITTVGYQLNYKVGSYVTESMQNKVPDIFVTTT